MTKTVFRTTAKKASSAVVQFAPGEVIFSEGDVGGEMFILQAGRVEIVKLIGGEDRRLAILEKGDFFGEMSMLEEMPRNATARAVDHVSALTVSPITFDQMLRENPEIVVRMMRKLSARLRQVEDDLDRMAHALAATGGQQPTPAEPLSTAKKTPSSHCLVSENGETVFHLSVGSETSIGRRDPVTGIDPDVDLTQVDTQRSTSRAHARIYHRGRKFFLREEIGTSNGTFLNETKLQTGVPVELVDGDHVRFGLVKLIFRAGE
ncbi:MAG TPA: cyclic nucleotide-binding domain-containing protein [Thermoanaerobaculia bacterium]|jgi:CRP-like cAMP-binding protein|nr:cyclic nucleotide-binding domain-containing protein [Thermoanaerobaculia bacterium]